MHRALCCIVASALGALSVTAAAQDYPVKPIRFLVPSPAGGSPDLLARIFGSRLSEQLKQPVIIDNRGGASGIIGVEIVKNAAPDGYTLLLATSTVFGALPALKSKLPYDVDRDFTHLSRIAWVANVATVNADLGVNSVADLVRLARAKPGSLNYGSAGNGTPAHLAGAMFDVLAGVTTTHIAYKGAGLALSDMMGGQIQYLITSPLVAMPQARAGRIKVLATTGAQRDPLLPDLPSMAETVPGYDLVQWWGVSVAKATPAAITQRLHKELVAALNHPDAKAQINKNGATTSPESSESFTAFIKSERSRITNVGKKAGIVLD
jgi:tripartite-type tricarboxylate transporter receptor subunit TctC